FRSRLRSSHARADRAGVANSFDEEVLHAAAPISEDRLIADEPDAHNVARQRDHPEPSVLDEVNGDISRHLADPILDAAKMREQRRIEVRAFDLVTMSVLAVEAGREVELDALAGFVGDELGARFHDADF